MIKRSITILIFFLACLEAHAQQEVQFSQYIFNGLAVNPAYAGYKEALYLHTSYRQQWSGFPGAPVTGTFSADGLTDYADKRVGWGVLTSLEKLGPQSATALFVNYSYRIPMDWEDEKRLALGLGVGVTNYSVDGSNRKYVDADDPEVILGRQSTLVPDARVGLYYNSATSYIGVSVLNLFSAYTSGKIFLGNGLLYSSLRKSRHLYLSAGTLFPLNQDVQLKPSILVKGDFKGPVNVDVNVFVLLQETLWIGASYRTGFNYPGNTNLQPNLDPNNAFSVLMEVYANDNLRIGYSYDFSTSGISRYQRGSHELSLGITIPSINSMNKVKCPRHF
ncbi:PorP/SprF family type IX secretion system membrane protein [Chitinophaga silvisoli]|uniref:Type IX secretion system membrane protein PorP/SprF n=1 Tax=Chitinophaga silvisoli TaxID=2291814 RepID=A0A3E1NWF1_9BACT|nr:type IX secretion system membrane protein PorP/SprF [Chitinophaga silvisoli]RFM32252.1 type IX secretion system membrane protein PorP/SprF [Chitinophaga silvisoli]